MCPPHRDVQAIAAPSRQGISRGRFLQGALSALSLAVVQPERALAASQSQPPWEVPGYPGSRVLWIYRDGVDASGKAFRYNLRLPFYFPQTGLYRQGYFNLCAVMRDVHVPFNVGDAYIDPKLLFALWEIQVRTALEGLGYRPIQVYSVFRTHETNANIPGAAPQSAHLKGEAADFSTPGVAISTTYEITAAQRDDDHRRGGSRFIGGLGRYAEHVHADTRPGLFTW